MSQIETYRGHNGKINLAQFSNSSNEELSNVFFSSAEDGRLIIWDKRNAGIVNQLKNPTGKPFFSIDSSDKYIVCGSYSAVVLYSIMKMKVTRTFAEVHADDVTSTVFNKEGSLILTCGEDGLLNLIDLKGEKEDDFLYGSYCSEQPLRFCGFIDNTNLGFACNAMSEFEIIDLDTMLLKSKISKFEHEVDYLISC